MYRISKEFHFSAAHQLNGLPDDHPCSRLHGHNYIVKIELQNDRLDQCGFLVDYGDLKPIKEYIDNVLDHHNLNDILNMQTSAENIAKHLYDMWHNHPSWSHCKMIVHVSETPKTWALYNE